MDYDVLVLGGGAAGLTAAGVAAHFGAKTLLVERHRLGGDCTWTGCMPSKALLKAAEVAHAIRHADRYGLAAREPEVDFGRVMARVRAVREEIYRDADAPEIYRAMDIDVAAGTARFVDEHTVEIEGEPGTRRVTARYVVIAAGGRPRVPPVDGLADVPYLTSETLFELTERPDRLAVLGAGPIGTEMAQAFRRLGSDVTVVDRRERILARDDAEPAAMLRGRLEEEGVRYRLGADVRHARPDGDGVTLELEVGGAAYRVEADALLVAAGRRPNVEGLRLEAAGIDYTERGITTDRRGRTRRSHIYAVGDVTGRFQFTHMSEHMAKVAVTSALLKVPMKVDGAHLPWVTFTDPELAHVGATPAALREAGRRFQVYRFPYDRLDRAVAEGATLGLVKVYARPWDGKILGASVLGARAGELVGELAVAMKHGVTLRRLADTIHPYPTYGLGARRAADQWYVQQQRPWLVRLLQRVFGYRGPVIEPDPDRIV